MFQILTAWTHSRSKRLTILCFIFPSLTLILLIISFHNKLKITKASSHKATTSHWKQLTTFWHNQLLKRMSARGLKIYKEMQSTTSFVAPNFKTTWRAMKSIYKTLPNSTSVLKIPHHFNFHRQFPIQIENLYRLWVQSTNKLRTNNWCKRLTNKKSDGSNENKKRLRSNFKIKI